MLENWMDKLIELFKQYKRETWTSYEYILFRDNDAWLQARCIDDWKEIYIVRQAEILSKKMGFIKRLVENDKIDLLKLTCMNPRYTEIIDSDFSWEDRIIMILSIQNDPITFLLSVLK